MVPEPYITNLAGVISRIVTLGFNGANVRALPHLRFRRSVYGRSHLLGKATLGSRDIPIVSFCKPLNTALKC